MDVYGNFGELCRQQRLNQNYTLRQFCQKFDFEPSFISFFECNYIEPKIVLEKIDQLLEAYALPLPNDLEEVLHKNYKEFNKDEYFPSVLTNIAEEDIPVLQELVHASLNKHNRR